MSRLHKIGVITKCDSDHIVSTYQWKCCCELFLGDIMGHRLGSRPSLTFSHSVMNQVAFSVRSSPRISLSIDSSRPVFFPVKKLAEHADMSHRKFGMVKIHARRWRHVDLHQSLDASERAVLRYSNSRIQHIEGGRAAGTGRTHRDVRLGHSTTEAKEGCDIMIMWPVLVRIVVRDL